MAVVIDLKNDATSKLNIPPVALSTTTQGASIDGYNMGAETNMFLLAGITNSLQVTVMTVQAEESTDGTTWTTLTQGPCAISVTSLGLSRDVQVSHGKRSLRYLRANVVTLAAVTTVGAFTAAVLFVANSKMTPQVSGADRYPSS